MSVARLKEDGRKEGTVVPWKDVRKKEVRSVKCEVED